MKRLILSIITIFSICWAIYAQGTVEAEFDTLYYFQFETLFGTHAKRVLIDEAHNTIYSVPYGRETVREMLRIMQEDGFNIQFTKQVLDSANLKTSKADILIIHGMPNDKIKLNSGNKNEIIYKSPLKDKEVIDILTYVYKGGGLLSHFPGGSGALPLLEAFNIKFRDGYAYHPNSPGYKGGLCSHFIMTKDNGLLNTQHPVLATRCSDVLLPDTVKFLCGAAVFRNPEDNLLLFPNNTVNFTPANGVQDIEESSDSYAGMIGFEFGAGRVIVCTDQGIFRSLDLLIDGEKIPVTIHDPECDNAELFLNSIRWLGKLQ
ncbi:MAG: hypothetical protein HC831_03550 [Chloroflexia bacterium]|nr:hypothetical protein [Chloroflexia bacterium]